MKINELTYWATLSMIQGIQTRRKNELYANCYSHKSKYSIIDLFERKDIWDEIGMKEDEKVVFASSYGQLANNSFLVEDLYSQGYEIIPIDSPYYPRELKNNLKRSAPCLIYSKGNKELLNKPSTAIVGSRRADEISLHFVDNVARKAVSERRVVISGFAKGVDRQALDSAVDAGGCSIIVLPQGIATFASGFRQYYKQILEGRVTVISTFYPKASWSKELAMARNSVIYGMAGEIYAAQSDSKGGTWSGVMDGLRKGRTVFVRTPEPNENNANILLIQNGAVGVDMYGNKRLNITSVACDSLLQENNNEGYCTSSEEKLACRILALLERGSMMSKDIIHNLALDWTDAKMKKYLRSLPEIMESKISGKIYFSLKSLSMFES